MTHRDPRKRKSKAPRASPRDASFDHFFNEAADDLEDRRQRAWELVYEAMEAGPGNAMGLVRRALKLDPRNVDANLMAIEGARMKLEARIEKLRETVAMGAENLGASFERLKGCFWGVLETRPYMRARACLAMALRDAGRWEEAVTEWEAMLELNPNDNQGIRYELLGACLRLGRLETVRKLFARGDERRLSTIFAWGAVLERFLLGDREEAARALVLAREQNPHSEAFITGRRKLPREEPDGYSSGSEEEAICFAATLRAAWECHPEALSWLSSFTRK